jgi:ribosomal protein L2
MFLKFFLLYERSTISNSTRNSFRFFIYFCLQKKNKHLSLKKKSNSGHNLTGRRIIRTKTSTLRKFKIIKVNYNLNYNKLGFISSFQFIPYKNKLLTLIYFSNGAITYYNSTSIHKLFSYYYLNTYKKLKYKFKFLKAYYTFIFLMSKLTYISFFKTHPAKKVQYCLSPGTSSRIFSIDKITKTVLMELPSDSKKLISSLSFAFFSEMAFKNNKKFHNPKAGY